MFTVGTLKIGTFISPNFWLVPLKCLVLTEQIFHKREAKWPDFAEKHQGWLVAVAWVHRHLSLGPCLEASRAYFSEAQSGGTKES